VLITGRLHPRSGSTGVITGPFPVPPLDWEIELDGAYEGSVAARERDLRKIRMRG
jgi:hypothetical protein